MRRALLVAGLLALSGQAAAGLPPRYGGDLVVALPAAPVELDPARASTPADLLAARALHATLVEVDAVGALRPGLLAALPEAEPGDRAFRMRLRPGLRFHDGQPVTAADVAASLSRLLLPAVRSSHGWIALPIQGAEEVRQGRAATLPGVEVLSDLELRVVLDLPFPELPRALAAAPAAVVKARDGEARPASGAGPFRLAPGSAGAAGQIRLLAFDGFHRGRPYADGVTLAWTDSRRAARAFGRGELDLLLGPEAPPGAAARALPALTVTCALVNAARLGKAAEPLRRALGAVDRAELVRLFVRGPASPLLGLLPPALWPGAGGNSPPGAPARVSEAPRLALLVSAGPDFHRAVAGRLQVKLFDRGLRVAVEALPPEVLAARVASGDFDLALLSVTFAATGPALAVLEAAWALGGSAAARRALARLATPDPAAAASEVAQELGAVPLLGSGLLAAARPGLQGLAAGPDGLVSLGDLWILPARPGR